MKLTKEQSEIVAKNHNLIWDFINKNKLDENEYYGLVAIALCEAVIGYDESRGSLSNYFWICAKNSLRNYYRDTGKTLKKNQHNGLVSLEDVAEMIEDCEDVYFDNINLLLDRCTDEVTRQILKLLYMGYNQREIADELNMSQSKVSRMIRDYREGLLDDR